MILTKVVECNASTQVTTNKGCSSQTRLGVILDRSSLHQHRNTSEHYRLTGWWVLSFDCSTSRSILPKVEAPPSLGSLFVFYVCIYDEFEKR